MQYQVSLVLSGASLIAQLIKNPPAIQEALIRFWVRRILWRRDRLPTAVFLGFPCGSVGKDFTCNAGVLGLIPGLGRSPGEGTGFPRQHSGLENSMDCIVHGVVKSWTRLSNFHFTSLRSSPDSPGGPPPLRACLLLSLMSLAPAVTHCSAGHLSATERQH